MNGKYKVKFCNEFSSIEKMKLGVDLSMEKDDFSVNSVKKFNKGIK